MPTVRVEIQGENTTPPGKILQTRDDGGVLVRFWGWLKDNDIRWLAKGSSDYVEGRWVGFFTQEEGVHIRAWLEKQPEFSQVGSEELPRG